MEELNLSSLSTEVQLSPDSKNIKIDDLRGVRAALIEDIDLEIQAAGVKQNEKDANEPNQGTPTGSFENTPSSLKNGDTFDLEDTSDVKPKMKSNSSLLLYANCKKCGKKYSNKAKNWKYHLKKHEKSCEVSTSSELPTYDSLKIISCRICGISSKSRQSVRCHYLSMHFEKKLNQDYGCVWETEPYNCQFKDCSFKASKKQKLQIHYLYDHDLFKKYIEEEIELKSKVSENKMKSCKICGI